MARDLRLSGTVRSVDVAALSHRRKVKLFITWRKISSDNDQVCLSSVPGSIASPQHPLAYPHNARCEWRISVSEGSTIEIIFTDLDFET